jgi:hypothetical protein
VNSLIYTWCTTSTTSEHTVFSTMKKKKIQKWVLNKWKSGELTHSKRDLWSDTNEGHTRREDCLIDSSGVCSYYSRNMCTWVKYVSNNKTIERSKNNQNIPCDSEEQLSNGSLSGTSALDPSYASPTRSRKNFCFSSFFLWKHTQTTYRSQIQLCILDRNILQELDVNSKRLYQ